MHTYLSIGLAVAVLTAFAQPLSAAPKNKGRSTSAKHAQAAKPSKHAKASQSKSVGHRKFTAVARSKAPAPQFRNAPTVAKRDVVRGKAHPQQFRSASLVAAKQQNLARSNARALESREGIREYNYRSDVRRYRPPVDIYRDWDRDRVYSWNRHRYHWHGSAWVILDANPGYYHYDYPANYVYRDSPSYSDSLTARVQSRLADEGYDPGPIDGVIGPQTRDAIAAFQADNGLSVTGSVDDSLLRALGL